VVGEETSVDEEFQRFIRNPTLALEHWETQIIAYDGSDAPVFATDEEGTLALEIRDNFQGDDPT